MSKKVFVCQNSTCQQQGAKQVLSAFQACAQQRCQRLDQPVESALAKHINASEIERREMESTVPFVPVASGCLGQCGNGPMVLVVPYPPEANVAKVWYHKVRPTDVHLIAKQHLLGDRPIARLLYPAVHGSQKSIWPWIIGLVIFFLGCIALAWLVGSRYSHLT